MLPCHILAYHLWPSLASSSVKAVEPGLVQCCPALFCPALPCPALPCPSCPLVTCCAFPGFPSPYSAVPHLFSPYLPCPYLTFRLPCLLSVLCPACSAPCPGACSVPCPVLALGPVLSSALPLALSLPCSLPSLPRSAQFGPLLSPSQTIQVSAPTEMPLGSMWCCVIHAHQFMTASHACRRKTHKA